MAAYRRVDGLVTCGLTACTPGSAPGPTFGKEYGRILPVLRSQLRLVLDLATPGPPRLRSLQGLIDLVWLVKY